MNNTLSLGRFDWNVVACALGPKQLTSSGYLSGLTDLFEFEVLGRGHGRSIGPNIGRW